MITILPTFYFTEETKAIEWEYFRISLVSFKILSLSPSTPSSILSIQRKVYFKTVLRFLSILMHLNLFSLVFPVLLQLFFSLMFSVPYSLQTSSPWCAYILRSSLFQRALSLLPTHHFLSFPYPSSYKNSDPHMQPHNLPLNTQYAFCAPSASQINF